MTDQVPTPSPLQSPSPPPPGPPGSRAFRAFIRERRDPRVTAWLAKLAPPFMSWAEYLEWRDGRRRQP